MTGKLDYNQALDLSIEAGRDDTRPFWELSTLVTLYFPELDHLRERLLDLRDTGAALLAGHRRRYTSQGVDSQAVEGMRRLLGTLDELERDFDTCLRELVPEIRP